MPARSPSRLVSWIHLSEVGDGAVRLLEVIADLLVPRFAVRLAREPLGRRRMEADPEGLRDGVVGGLSREGVAEAVRLSGRLGIGHHEIPLREVAQFRVHVDLVATRQERVHLFLRERETQHGRSFQHLAARQFEPIDPGRQERRDRRRDRDPREVPLGRVRCDRSFLLEHGDDLLEEERIPLGDVGDRVLEGRCGRGHEQMAGELAARLGTERLELEGHGARRSAPGGPGVQELRAGETQQEDRSVTCPFGEVLEDVQERRRRPVHVVERDHQRAAPGDRFDTDTDRPRGLLLGRGAGRQPQRSRDTVGRHRSLGMAGQEIADPLHGDGRIRVGSETRRLTDHIDEGPKRAALTVRGAPAAEHDVGIGVRSEELGDEPCLPEPGAPDQGDRPAARGRDMALEGLVQEPELRGPIDERRFRAGRAFARIDDVQEPVRGHGPVETAEVLERHRLRRDRVADDPFRDAVEEDLARTGVLLQAGREVHGRPHHERLTGAPIARDHVARGDAGADRELHVPPPKEIAVRDVDHLPQVPGCTNGAKRVVLRRTWETEDGHDRVADELLDVPAVTADGGARGTVVVAHHAMEGFGVEPVSQVRGPGQVDEQDRHLAPRFRRLRDVERPAAGQAEASVLRVVCGARRTGRHGSKPTAGRELMGPVQEHEPGSAVATARDQAAP